MALFPNVFVGNQDKAKRCFSGWTGSNSIKSIFVGVNDVARKVKEPGYSLSFVSLQENTFPNLGSYIVKANSKNKMFIWGSSGAYLADEKLTVSPISNLTNKSNSIRVCGVKTGVFIIRTSYIEKINDNGTIENTNQTFYFGSGYTGYSWYKNGGMIDGNFVYDSSRNGYFPETIRFLGDSDFVVSNLYYNGIAIYSGGATIASIPNVTTFSFAASSNFKTYHYFMSTSGTFSSATISLVSNHMGSTGRYTSNVATTDKHIFYLGGSTISSNGFSSTYQSDAIDSNMVNTYLGNDGVAYSKIFEIKNKYVVYSISYLNPSGYLPFNVFDDNLTKSTFKSSFSCEAGSVRGNGSGVGDYMLFVCSELTNSNYKNGIILKFVIR